MKVFIVLSAILAITSAAHITLLSPVSTDLRSANIFLRAYAAVPTQQQYHAQDVLGQYSYGYSDSLSSKQESRSLDGVTRGSYSYRDAEGKLQTVDYTADEGGFRVQSPSLVSDTVEVTAARAAHLAAVNQESSNSRLEEAVKSFESSQAPAFAEQSSSSEGRSSEQQTAPKPVEDTPEVAAAKAEHLQRFEDERLRNIALSKNNYISYQAKSPLIQTIVPTVYSYSYPLRHAYVPNAVVNSRFLASNVIY